MTNVRWLTRYGPEGASSRYRVHQFIGPLESAGIRSTVEPLARWQANMLDASVSVSRRIATLARGPRSDVLVVQKAPIMPARLWPIARRLLSRTRVPIIWDIDDAIWANGSAERRMAEEMAQLAAVVVVGNELLASWAASAGARRVVTIPTCFSPPGAPDALRRTGDTVDVVWIGSPSTAELLRPEEDRLRAILDTPGARLIMVGGEPPPGLAERYDVVELQWSPEVEHEQLSAADFGLALQPRTEFADHKCGFKIIQYLAYGVAPIATDNPVHRTVLGGLGTLVGPNFTTDELRSVVTRRVTDDDRKRFQERWRDHFSASVGVAAWRELIQELAS